MFQKLPFTGIVRSVLSLFHPLMAQEKTLRPGDVVVVSGGELIPADGDIIHGIALVDESAITGESAPVIREAGGDHAGVVAGTRVLPDSGSIKVRVKAARRQPGG